MPRKPKFQETASALTAKNDYAITWPDLLTEPFKSVKGRTWTRVQKSVGTVLEITEPNVFALLMMVEAYLQNEDEIPAEVLNKFPAGGLSVGEYQKSIVILRKKGLLGDPTKKLRRERDEVLGAYVPNQALMSYLLSGKSDFLELLTPKSKGNQDNLLRLALLCTHESGNPFDEAESSAKLYTEIANQQANPLIKAMNKARYTLREQVTVLLAIGHRLNGKMEIPLRQLVDQTFDDPLEQLTTHNEWSKVNSSLFAAGKRLLLPSQKNDQKVTHVRLNTEAILPLVPGKLVDSLEIQVPDTAMLTIERWTNIPEIELFYPETFFKQVEKLSQTLEEGNLNRYFDRLKSLNMLPSLMVMLSGSPGTGKTELCRQLARLHQRDLVLVNLSAIRSKWYGETEKCVERLFSAIRATQDAMDRMPLVLFNEADSFFISRGKGGPSSNVSNTENTLVTMFLEMLERCKGLFLATTNHTESMDPAFERRWAFKLTVPNPDDETKFLLLQKSLGGLVKETTLRHWSQHYQFTGAQLRNVQRKLLLYHESDLTSELLEEILNQELNGWKISKPLHRAQIEGFRAA